MGRPNKRQRKAGRKAKEKAKYTKLINVYERRLKASLITSEQKMLREKIENLKSGNYIEKPLSQRKDDPALTGPNIPSTLGKKRRLKNGFVKVYQGGSTGLKK